MNKLFRPLKRNKYIFILAFGVLILFYSIFIYKKLNPINQVNLMKFHSLTATDPLFYDPNTDVNHLRSALQSLKKLDDEVVRINSFYLNSQPNTYQLNVFPKDWTVWPEGFLATLPQIHKITTDFITKPTQKNSIELLNSYEQATKQYANAIDLDIQALNTFLDRSPEYKKGAKKILFLGSATTPQIALNDFMVIRKNAEALENELIERKKCLYDGLCSPKNIKEPIIDNNDAVKIPLMPLTDKILDIDRSKDLVFGPFYASTGCFGFTQDQKEYSYPFFVVEKKSGYRNGLIIPMLTNTKFYQDYRLFPEQATSILWQKYGYPVRDHDATTDYLCSDLRYVPFLYLNYLKEKQGNNNSISTKNILSVLPYLAERTALYGDYLLYDFRDNKKPQNPLYLLINRGAYSLYFGTFTSRVWRIPYSPTFLIKKTFSEFSGINVTYEQLVAQGLSQDEIAKFNTSVDPRK